METHNIHKQKKIKLKKYVYRYIAYVHVHCTVTLLLKNEIQCLRLIYNQFTSFNEYLYKFFFLSCKI